MAETSETNFDEFKGKDCVFVANWLKTKGLHKLCSVFEDVQERFISIIHKNVLSNKPCYNMHNLRSIREATEKLKQ